MSRKVFCALTGVVVCGVIAAPAYAAGLHVDAPETQIDCLWLGMCRDGGVCQCTATECTAAHQSYLLSQVDASLDAARTSLSGTFVISDASPRTGASDRVVIKLTRQ